MLSLHPIVESPLEKYLLERPPRVFSLSRFTLNFSLLTFTFLLLENMLYLHPIVKSPTSAWKISLRTTTALLKNTSRSLSSFHFHFHFDKRRFIFTFNCQNPDLCLKNTRRPLYEKHASELPPVFSLHFSSAFHLTTIVPLCLPGLLALNALVVVCLLFVFVVCSNTTDLCPLGLS